MSPVIVGDDESGAFDPATTELEWGRTDGGKVHVLIPLREGDGKISGTNIDYAELTAWFRLRTLCGQLLAAGSTHRTDAFADDLLCMRCHAGMGEHSDRLFEHAYSYETEIGVTDER
jgi:hypothetical protein